jgi:cell division protein ZapA
MAELDVRIGGRNYELSCRAGDEDRLRALAAMVDAKTVTLAKTMGGLNEVRQLLFASLLLADELAEALAKVAAAAAPPPETERMDEATAELVEGLATRVDAIAARLEKGIPRA